MQKPRTLPVLAFLVLLANALPAAERLFPLDAGNFWQYQTADGKHRFQVESSLPVLNHGKAYHYVRGYLTERHILREEPGKGIFWFDEESDSERLATSFDAAGQPGFPAEHRPCGTIAGMVRIAREGHSTPSGYWPDALRIDYESANCGDAALVSELFVAGVGMIQRTVKLGEETRVFDLVSARVGHLLVLSRDTSVTRLTVYPQVHGDTSIRMLLQVVGSFGSEAPITFPSTQRYDILIRDTQGNKIWQYSDAKAFVDTAQTVTGGIDLEIEIPLSALPGGTIAPGRYLVEGWLVTNRANPSFAASAEVTIEDFGQPPAGTSAGIRFGGRPGIGLPLPGRPFRR